MNEAGPTTPSQHSPDTETLIKVIDKRAFDRAEVGIEQDTLSWVKGSEATYQEQQSETTPSVPELAENYSEPAPITPDTSNKSVENSVPKRNPNFRPGRIISRLEKKLGITDEPTTPETTPVATSSLATSIRLASERFAQFLDARATDKLHKQAIAANEAFDTQAEKDKQNTAFATYEDNLNYSEEKQATIRQRAEHVKQLDQQEKREALLERGSRFIRAVGKAGLIATGAIIVGSERARDNVKAFVKNIQETDFSQKTKEQAAELRRKTAERTAATKLRSAELTKQTTERAQLAKERTKLFGRKALKNARTTSARIKATTESAKDAWKHYGNQSDVDTAA